MSAPVARRFQSELTKTARQLERLKLRRRKDVKRLQETEADIRETMKRLRMLAESAWPELAGPGPHELLPGESEAQS